MIKTALTLLLIVCVSLTNAQSFLGLKQDSYAGVLGMDYQPASIADSRYKVDVNLFGFDLSAYNSYLGVDSKLLTVYTPADDPRFEDNYKDYFSDSHKSEHQILGRVDLSILSTMITLNNKHAVGFGARFRTYANVDGFTDEFGELMFNDIDVPKLWHKKLLNERLDVQAMSWMEYYLNYARVIYDNDEHFVKVGGKIKFLQGLGAAYIRIKDFDYSFLNSDTLALFNVDVD